MVWNTENEDCVFAGEIDSHRTNPTCDFTAHNGNYCVQQNSTRPGFGVQCDPTHPIKEYCPDGSVCPPLKPGAKYSLCPGEDPAFCADTPNTKESCSGSIPGSPSGKYLWCKKDDPGPIDYNCGEAPDYCGPHGYCTKDGCICMPHFSINEATGRCDLSPGLTPGMLCNNSQCPADFLCVITQDINGNIDIDRSALGYSCRYNANDLCCPHNKDFPCTLSDNAHWSCEKKMGKEAKDGIAPYSPVTWHEDGDNAGSYGKCIIGHEKAPTCRAVLKKSSKPPNV